MSLTLGSGLTLAKGQPVPNDPNFAFNSLLLHGNGANGSTVITDSSGSPKTVTPFGNAQISTAQSKFGGSSIAFDGTGDYLIAPAGDAFNFGTLPFTIECWVWRKAGIVANQTIFSQRTATSGVTFLIGTSDSIRAFFGAGFGAVTSPIAVPAEAFAHVALTYPGFGGAFTLWMNGQNVASSSPFGHVFEDNVAPFIGARPTTTENLNGYIDDLRITKGVARYTSNFTPPTAPFPDF